ncbi:Rv3235 family protein [Amycolatopsis sp. CA-230715]|uniref:Rv3235 family protein n=1 Tax=Amycolatopsis sp. CA-230715 TaxID=2745196 RepID=UPI001C039E87|nr:Rv3235 family protein [Amycolatopsis sp. CA-230715]QWF82253.1 hypothetical protein HUW46_05690 [Amycolatopsis sp. CA-230715]
MDQRESRRLVPLDQIEEFRPRARSGPRPQHATTERKLGGAQRTLPDFTTLFSAILEVREGHRAAVQVRRFLHPRLYARLTSRGPTAGTRYTVRSVRATSPLRGVVETCGVVHTRGRALAVTARFERRRQGWLCTEFALLTGTPTE